MLSEKSPSSSSPSSSSSSSSSRVRMNCCRIVYVSLHGKDALQHLFAGRVSEPVVVEGFEEEGEDDDEDEEELLSNRLYEFG